MKMMRPNPFLARAVALLRWTIVALAAAGALWWTAAMVGARMPVNADWREAATGHIIYVETNGVHAGLILPADSGPWRQWFPPSHFALPYADVSHYRFGWGAMEFYRKVPAWRDVTPPIVIRALFTDGTAGMNVVQLVAPRASATVRPLRVTDAEMAAIVAAIRASFDPAGLSKPIPGNAPDEAFYAARGRYSLFRTCNVWTGDVLRGAGIRTGRWTPLAAGVMRWRE